MKTFLRITGFMSVALVAALLGACGGGTSSGPNPPPPPPTQPPPPPAAPANPLVYIASDDPASGVFELYLVDLATPGEATKINPPLVAGGAVGPYALSPDLTHVAYIATQDVVDEWDLYIVDLANPGTSTKVTPTVTPPPGALGIFVSEFAFSPDGNQIVYTADHPDGPFGQFELFLVDLDDPGVSTKLNPDLPTDAQVLDGMSFSPDGNSVLYVADLDAAMQYDAWLVELSAPGVATRVNGPLVADGTVVGAPTFSLDGRTIVYLAAQDAPDVLELYAVDVANPGTAVKLNPPLVAEGDLCTFRFSPDSTKVGYCADQDIDGVLELYVVDLAVPGVSTKVNPPLVDGGDVQAATFRFGPDSDFMVYRADQDVDGDNELYMVDLTTPGVSAKLNGTLPASGDVSFFRINPDGLQLIYAADQDTEGLAELYNVDLSTPGSSTKLNPARQGSQITQIELNEDGSQAFYLADQDTAGVGEIYRIDIADAGIATKISDALPATGSVFDFALEPGYRAP